MAMAQSAAAHAKEVAFRGRRDRSEAGRRKAARLQSGGTLHVSPCNTSLPLTPSPFPVLFCRARSLLRLQPFATLDLALNEAQSNLKSTNQ